MVELGEYELEKLRDSRLFYMRNPPKFLYITIFVIIAILIGALIWSCIAVKAEEVENSGIIVDSSICIVSADVSGSVNSVDVSEGDKVSVGDMVFALDSSAVESERNTYVVSKEHYTERLASVNKFIDNIDKTNTNPFSKDGDEKEFYDLWQSYRNELSQVAVQNQSDNVRLKYLSNMYSERSTLEREIRTADIYQTTITADNKRIGYIDRMLEELEDGGTDNPFTDSGDEAEFYIIFETYVSEYNALTDLDKKDALRRTYMTNLYSQRSELSKEVSSAMVYVESASGYGTRLTYVEKMISSLERSSTTNPFSNSGEQKEFYNLFEAYLVELDQLDIKDQKESIRLKYLSSMQSEKNNCEQQVRSAESSISICDANIERYTVKASSSGNIHFDVKLAQGAFIQAGTVVGSIDSGSGKQVEMYVSAHDRARLEVGQDCRFSIDGLLQTEFGTVEGKVESISSDATISDSGAYFRIIVSFDKDRLIDRSGSEVTIKNGMTVRMWTVYEKSTYMDYFLDRLGFI